MKQSQQRDLMRSSLGAAILVVVFFIIFYTRLESLHTILLVVTLAIAAVIVCFLPLFRHEPRKQAASLVFRRVIYIAVIAALVAVIVYMITLIAMP